MAQRQEFSNEELPIQDFLITMFGDANTGKTSLVDRFVNNTFRSNEPATIGAAFSYKFLSLDENKIKLVFWDAAGQERFRALIPMYCRKANAIIITYNVAVRDSFDHIEDSWMSIIKNHAPENIPIIIVGTRVDMLKEEGIKRAVTTEEAEQLAKRLSTEETPVVFAGETSAKENIGVKELFLGVAKRLNATVAPTPVETSTADNTLVELPPRSRFFHTGSTVTSLITAALLIACAAATIYFAGLPLLAVAIGSLIGIPVLSFVSGMISECFCYDKTEKSEIEMTTSTGYMGKRGLGFRTTSLDDSSNANHSNNGYQPIPTGTQPNASSNFAPQLETYINKPNDALANFTRANLTQ